MRYKAISSAVAILLLATPVFGQILVETPRTTNPTTVITGQPFRQTYVVRFIDLAHLGEEIIVKKEDFDQRFLGELEVVKFQIEYEVKQRQFIEHWLYLNYTLRIVDPKKGPKVIPSFVVPWKHKKSGQQENDPSLQYNYDLKTEEVHLNYASTIPEKDPNLTIRDLIDFGTFRITGLIFKYSSWFLAIVPMGLWLVLFVRRLRSSGATSKEVGPKSIQANEIVANDIPNISQRRALWNLRRAIRKLSKSVGPHSASQSINIVSAAMRDFLRVRTKLSVGATPLEMVAVISNNKKLGSFRKPLLALAYKARNYQQDIESGSVSAYDIPIEVNELRGLLTNLRWYNRLFRRR